MRRALPRTAGVAGARVYARDLAPELIDEVWSRFLDALEPLRSAAKLGASTSWCCTVR